VDMEALAKGFRRNYDLPEETFVVLQPTRLSPIKRVDRVMTFIPKLYRAFEERGCRKDIRFTITSQPPNPDVFPGVYMEIKRLEELLGLKEKVLYLNGAPRLREGITDACKTIEAAYAAADLVTFLSEYESWGLVPLEAAIYKRACFVNKYHRLAVVPYLTSHSIQGSRDYCTYAEIYKSKGFRFFEMDSVQTDLPTMEHARRVVETFTDPERLTAMLDRNFALAMQFYSKDRAAAKWRNILKYFGLA